MNNEESKPINYVHQATILNETVRKELKNQKLFTQFSINPFNKIFPLADKPNREEKALHDIDQHFIDIMNRAALEPNKKFDEPQTENQVYGWISQPLLAMDRSDRRFNRPKTTCEVTKFMEAYWREAEQQRLNA